MLLHKPFGYLLIAVLLLVGSGVSLAVEEARKVECECPKGDRMVVKIINPKQQSEPAVYIGGILSKIVPETTRLNPDKSVSFEVELPHELKPGMTPWEVRFGDEITKPEPLINIPDPLLDAGKQPEVLKVDPAGGFERAAIKVTGKNFGKTMDNIFITLGDLSHLVDPTYLSEEKDGEQELVFSIPTKREGKDILGAHNLYHRVPFSVTVNNRLTTWGFVNVIHPTGLWKIAGLSLAVVIILLAPFLTLLSLTFTVIAILLLGLALGFSLSSDYWWSSAVVFCILSLSLTAWTWKNRTALEPITRTLFIDKDSNSYSLSKFQAFSWTVVLIGTYLYFCIGRGLFLGKGVIPDFNSSLLGLMSISYGGLLISRGITNKLPKNDLTSTPPRFSDLITEGGSISIVRLQLLGFTFAAIIVFLYYVSDTDVFSRGLPDIPPTLNGLLAISVAGYLGGKVVGDAAVNIILPRRARAGETLKIFGSGFVDKTKILIQDESQPCDVKFFSSTSIEVPLPTTLNPPGMKQLLFVPPSGSSFVINSAFELIDPKVGAWIDPQDPGIVRANCEGIILQEGEVSAAIYGESAIVQTQKGNEFTIKSETEVRDGASLELKTKDAIILQATVHAK
jgi:hypothetical protein